MQNIVQNLDLNLNLILDNVINKQTFVKGIIYLLLILYSARIAPTPPKVVLDLFENIYFKLFTFSLILWTAQFSPSTSILIALAFMITLNYSTTGKIWEMMENTNVTTVTPIQSVTILANAASSPVASNPDTIAPIAQVALSAVHTQTGADAVNALATQAITPAPGTPTNVAAAVQTALQDMNTVPAPVVVPESVVVPAPAPTSASFAPAPVVVPAPTPAPVVVPAPAVQVVVPAPASSSFSPVTSSVDQNETPVETQSSGCYPLRNYDMSKVHGMKDGNDSFEDYQTFNTSSV